jgi:hypothetical protein
MRFASLPHERRFTVIALGFALATVAAAPISAQGSRRAAQPASQDSTAGRRRCPTCAPAPTRAPGGSANAPARRGAPGAAHGPLTSASISLGGASYDGQVDADCHVDERATPGTTRAYFVARYPWFGYRPPASEPQWRFDLSIRRGATPGVYDQFVFSFGDGPRSGVIQTVAGSQRMGSGTVRVTRHGAGARFDVVGRSEKGEPIRATIDCPAFQGSEANSG